LAKERKKKDGKMQQPENEKKNEKKKIPKVEVFLLCQLWSAVSLSSPFFFWTISCKTNKKALPPGFFPMNLRRFSPFYGLRARAG
jgi:hypothetical protein